MTEASRPKGDRVLSCTRCDRAWVPAVLRRVHRARRPAPDEVLSFVHEPNGSGHDDVVVRVGDQLYRSDSYYFGLDHRTDEEADGERSMRQMLEGWRRDVLGCQPGQHVFLPHDFSDQYSGWIRVRASSADALQLQAGWATIEGWAIPPSRYDDVLRERPSALEDFTPGESPSVRADRDAVLRGVARSLELLTG